MTTGARPQHPFDVRHADVWKIAIPASVAFITEPLVGIVDITVIGRLGDAGLLGGLGRPRRSWRRAPASAQRSRTISSSASAVRPSC